MVATVVLSQDLAILWAGGNGRGRAGMGMDGRMGGYPKNPRPLPGIYKGTLKYFQNFSGLSS